jgi:hypothetical protein
MQAFSGQQVQIVGTFPSGPAGPAATPTGTSGATGTTAATGTTGTPGATGPATIPEFRVLIVRPLGPCPRQ